jgi:uncharacterized protein YoxC
VAGYAALIASLGFVVLVAVAVPTLLQVRRTARTAEQTLSTVEREIRPLLTELHALLQDHRELAQRASRDLREVEGIVLMAQEVLLRVIKLSGLLSGVGTVGRVVGVAQGLRKGIDVFVRHFGKRSG